MSGFITSNYFSNCVQNSAFQVLSEGSLKAVGRPAFTLLDKNATPEQKKYSALKEATFQFASMGLYFAAVMTVVKGGGYKMLRKMPVFKDMDVCKNIKHFNGKEGFSAKFGEAMKDKKLNPQTKKNYELTKGAMEFITMVGSGVILTVLCPMIVSKKLVHPVMDAYDKHVAAKKNAAENTDNLNKILI